MNNNRNNTICAPATIPGTGAISIIRASGPDTFAIADKVISCNGLPISETEGYKIRYGTIHEPDGHVLDNVLVSVFRAPHSYTGEDSIEISCHASSYIVSRIIEYLVNAGAQPAGPGEFTRRAFLNGKMDLSQAEAVADVISSTSESAHRVAMNQLKGGVSKELKILRDKLLKMTSLLELELDFSEEDVEFASREELKRLVDETLSHITHLTDTFSRGNAIKNGVPVAIIGATNTGKSTLLNTLIGDDRAIVSDIEGTTRDTIEETMNIGGTLFRFIDTAGIRDTDETVEQIGIGRTFKKLGEAAIILGMLDFSRGVKQAVSDAEFIRNKVKDVGQDNIIDTQRLVFLLNKCDIAGCHEDSIPDNSHMSIPEADMYINALRQNGIDNKVIPISAKNGYGIASLKELLDSIGNRVTGGEDSTLITNVRHFAALTAAASALKRIGPALSDSVPPEFIAQDLREALYHLGTIVGEVTTDEVLGNIFKNFCIGK